MSTSVQVNFLNLDFDDDCDDVDVDDYDDDNLDDDLDDDLDDEALAAWSVNISSG